MSTALNASTSDVMDVNGASLLTECLDARGHM